MTRKLFSLGLVSVVAIAACSAVDAVDNAGDCDGICKRYATCFDAKYDTSACASRCRSSSSSDKDFLRKVDTCNACIEDRDCTAATFKCATECGGVVP